MTAPKILNVDDQQISRYIRTQTLKAAGYRVIEAATGAEALRLVDAEHPQIVLLDMNLPDIHGTEICRRIRKQESTQFIIVVHVSATQTTIQDQTSGLDGGADGYLVEPVEPELLLATVRSFLRLRTAEIRLEQSLAETREANAALQRSNEDLTQFPMPPVTICRNRYERWPRIPTCWCGNMPIGWTRTRISISRLPRMPSGACRC